MAIRNFDIDASADITKPGKVLLFDVPGKQSWLRDARKEKKTLNIIYMLYF